MMALPDDVSNIDASIKEKSSLSSHAVPVGDVATYAHVDGWAGRDKGHHMSHLCVCVCV